VKPLRKVLKYISSDPSLVAESLGENLTRSQCSTVASTGTSLQCSEFSGTMSLLNSQYPRPQRSIGSMVRMENVILHKLNEKSTI
jgi:hypothetical protein